MIPRKLALILFSRGNTWREVALYLRLDKLWLKLELLHTSRDLIASLGKGAF